MNETRWNSLPKATKNRIFESLKSLLSTASMKSFAQMRNVNPMDISQLRCDAKKARMELGDTLSKVALENLNSEQVAVIAKSIALLLSSIVDQRNRILSVDVSDIDAVVTALINLFLSGESLQKVVITTGMGGTTVIPTIRLPAYIIPAISTLEAINRLKKENIVQGLPTVRVFKANHIACAVNGYEMSKVQAVSEVTFRFLREFLDRFYPEYSGRFVFESDLDWPSQENSRVQAALTEGSRYLNSLTQPDIKNLVDKVKEMGTKHGGERGRERALFYAAAHPFYNQGLVSQGDPLPISNFVLESPSPVLVIDHGGEPQDVFNRLGNAIRKGLVEQGGYRCTPLLNLVHRAGKTPVYYTARGGDIPLGSNPQPQQELDRRVKTDLRIISDAVGEAEYLSFVREFTNEHRKLIDSLGL